MQLYVIIIIQIVFIYINLVIAEYQAYRFDTQQKRINHTLWLLYYIAACSVVWFLYHNLRLCSSLALMHLPVFNTALNYFRKPRRAFFYTHPEDPHGSKLDKLWGDAYPAIFFLCSIAYLTIIFFI